MSDVPQIKPGDRILDTLTGSIIIPGDQWGHYQQEMFKSDRYQLKDVAYYLQPASISHADWELLAVSDLAPYSDMRYEKPRTAEARGYVVLTILHKMLFGTYPDAECRECK